MNHQPHFFMQYPKSKPVPVPKSGGMFGWAVVAVGSLLTAMGAGVALSDALHEREQREAKKEIAK